MTSGLLPFLARRVLAAVAFVLVVATSAFVLGRLAPGDAGTIEQGRGADPKTVAQLRARLGLDRPLYAQLGGWIAGLARFDLGTSANGQAVAPLVAGRAVNTARLAAVALALATLIGLPIGILTGARPRGWLAAIVTPVSVALVACPPLVGALALLLFAMRTHWLSVSSGDVLLPALALALPIAAMLERLQSQATSEALSAPDLLATAARGVPPGRLLWVHAARQSLRPVLGVYGIVLGSLFSGSLAVEVVTSWPGLGRLMYDALGERDLFLVAGCALFGAICLALGNLLADVARVFVDPRVRDAV